MRPHHGGGTRPACRSRGTPSGHVHRGRSGAPLESATASARVRKKTSSGSAIRPRSASASPIRRTARRMTGHAIVSSTALALPESGRDDANWPAAGGKARRRSWRRGQRREGGWTRTPAWHRPPGRDALEVAIGSSGRNGCHQSSEHAWPCASRGRPQRPASNGGGLPPRTRRGVADEPGQVSPSLCRAGQGSDHMKYSPTSSASSRGLGGRRQHVSTRPSASATDAW